jgi:hypothetical protein
MWVSGTVTPLPRFTPGERTPVPTGQEAGWALEPAWTQKLQEKSSCPCRESNLDRLVVQSAAILTELPRLHLTEVEGAKINKIQLHLTTQWQQTQRKIVGKESSTSDNNNDLASTGEEFVYPRIKNGWWGYTITDYRIFVSLIHFLYQLSAGNNRDSTNDKHSYWCFHPRYKVLSKRTIFVVRP